MRNQDCYMIDALLAQLVERIHGKDEVTSSSLVEGLKIFKLKRLVVQWLELGSPKPSMGVRFSPGLYFFTREDLLGDSFL